MGADLRERLGETGLAHLRRAMDWVIPPDSSSGAGTEGGAFLLLDLVESQSVDIADAYATHVPTLKEADLADPSNSFAAMFVEHVRDVYYGSPETGAWSDIGFRLVGQ